MVLSTIRPYSPQLHAEGSPINGSGKRTSNLKVLVVEDDAMVGFLVEGFLEALGHTVVGPMARLETALEAAQRETFDLALLDINLDGQDVFPVVDILDGRHIPVIFVSGYGGSRLRARDNGKLVLQKPYMQEHLRTAIATIFPI
jgi:DNA-binding response OmpR family regulator